MLMRMRNTSTLDALCAIEGLLMLTGKVKRASGSLARTLTCAERFSVTNDLRKR
jgi:hypothetical protein